MIVCSSYFIRSRQWRQKGAAYGCLRNFSPPLKTFGFCCAKPKKKRRSCAAILNFSQFWCPCTTRLEPILRKTSEKHKPRRLAHASVRCAPPEKPFAYFFEISPAEIFLIWKRVFLVVRLPQAVEAARLQSAEPTRYAPSVYSKMAFAI